MKINYLVQGAVIAALYAALTILLMPISYGVMQIRVSEALTVLPALTPAAIPGIFLGCLISNMLGPNGMADIILGSLATLLASVATYKLRNKPLVVPLPPIIANGLIIGTMLHYVYGIPISLWACILWVSIGEGVACYGLGYPLFRYLKRRKEIIQ